MGSVRHAFTACACCLSSLAWAADDMHCGEALRAQGGGALLALEAIKTHCGSRQSRCGYHKLEFGGHTVLSLSCDFGMVQVWGAEDLAELAVRNGKLVGRCGTRRWSPASVMPGCYPEPLAPR